MVVMVLEERTKIGTLRRMWWWIQPTCCLTRREEEATTTKMIMGEKGPIWTMLLAWWMNCTFPRKRMGGV